MSTTFGIVIKNGELLDLPIYTPKKAVVQAINQFLIWYNEQTN